MTDTALSAHFHRVADESPVPVVLYNIPKYAHFALSPELVAILSRHHNVIGIKDSSGDVNSLRGYLLSQTATFTVLTGSGSSLLEALELGASGGILAVACFAVPLVREVYAALQRGDRATAARAQEALVPLAREIVGAYGPAGVKAAMQIVGLRGGSVRSRCSISARSRSPRCARCSRRWRSRPWRSSCCCWRSRRGWCSSPSACRGSGSWRWRSASTPGRCRRAASGPWTIGVAVGLALAAEIAEFVVTARATRRAGGSSRGAWWALGGSLVGALLGVPLPLVGSLVGAFLGAFVGAWFAEIIAGTLGGECDRGGGRRARGAGRRGGAQGRGGRDDRRLGGGGVVFHTSSAFPR